MIQQQGGQRHAGREHVGTQVQRLAGNLLRAHEVRPAHDDVGAVLGQEATGPRDAEVGKLHVALVADENVPQVRVAMDQAERLAVIARQTVRVGKPAQHAVDDIHGKIAWQARALRGKPGEQLLTVHAVDQLHDDEDVVGGAAEVVNLRDVRMHQPGDEPGFPDERLDDLGLAGGGGLDELKRDLLGKAIRADLLGFIHDTHAALGDELAQAEARRGFELLAVIHQPANQIYETSHVWKSRSADGHPRTGNGCYRSRP